MEMNNPLLIVLDPGHGGHDLGAIWNGRQEKDDNLRLGLAVRDALQYQGVETLMTRDTDVFIPLADRASIANASDADLFVSLHRNSFTEPTESTKGVENYIYLTAPEATTAHAARLVLDQVVQVGAQADRGVNRGNYYVLRKTTMPAMLLEMGFILNETDNRLFDEHLPAYAEAIAKGILTYFGLPYRDPAGGIVPPIGVLPPSQCTPPLIPMPTACVCPPGIDWPCPSPEPEEPPIGTLPPSPSRPDLVVEGQRALNGYFGANLTVDGKYGMQTKAAVIRALQMTINDSRSTNLPVDGVLGPDTRRLLPTLRQGDRGNAVLLLQILLSIHGYDPGRIDGVFGPRVKAAVELFQRNRLLVPDGVAGPLTFSYLLV